MAFFTYLPPEKESSESIKQFIEGNTIIPFFVKSTRLILNEGSLTYTVSNDKGIKALGILSKDTLKVYIRPSSVESDYFAEKLAYLLSQQEMPVWLLSDEGVGHKNDLIRKIIQNDKIRTEKILSLPHEMLNGLLKSYPIGQVSSIERQLANPRSTRTVKRLAKRVEHALLCQLSALIINKMKFETVKPEEIRDDCDINRYKVINCSLPVTVKGSVLNIITLKRDSKRHVILSAGVLRGNIVEIFYNAANDNIMKEILSQYLLELPNPIIVRDKRSVLEILDIAEEKLTPLSKDTYHNQFKGSSEGFTRNKVDINDWWEQYLLTRNSIGRETWKNKISFHNLSNLIYDSISLVIHAKIRRLYSDNSTLREFIEKTPSKISFISASRAIDDYKMESTKKKKPEETIEIMNFSPVVPPLPANSDLQVKVNLSRMKNIRKKKK